MKEVSELKIRYDELSFSEFETEIKDDPVFLLPVGATEEHGRHLPLGSDTYQATEIAARVAERIRGYVLPAIPYGVSEDLTDFPGTISVSFETLRSMVRDVLKELVRNGARRLVVISGHGSQLHMAAIRSACQEIVQASDAKALALCDYEIAYRLRGTLSIPQGDGHGGQIETSRMLAISESLVQEARPSGRNTAPPFLIPRHRRNYMTEGIIGDTSSASADLGRQINSYVVDELVKLINEVM